MSSRTIMFQWLRLDHISVNYVRLNSSLWEWIIAREIIRGFLSRHKLLITGEFERKSLDIIWHFLHPKHPIKVGSSSGNPHPPLKGRPKLIILKLWKRCEKNHGWFSFRVLTLLISPLVSKWSWEKIKNISFNIPDFWFTNIEITYEYKKMTIHYTLF